MQNAVYNSPVLNMAELLPPKSRVVRSLLAIICLLFGLTLPALGGEWAGPAALFAQKIAAIIGPGAVDVEFTNRSSLSKNQSDDVRRVLLSELASLGLRFVPAEQAAATVQVSLSENLQNYVWIAEIRSGAAQPSVVMTSLARPEGTGGARDAAPLTIRKSLLWSQEERILDAAMLDGSPSHLIVLDAGKVSLFKFQDSRWQPEQTLPIAHVRAWPRDMRGRLALRKDRLFDAYLPGVFCQSSTTVPLSLICRESDDPWPVGVDTFELKAFFTPSRNFFTGVLVPGVGKQSTAPSFYTAAPLPRDKYSLWLFAAVDGQLHMLDGIRDQALAKTGWGSDIATLKSSCGLGWQVLATRAGESTTDQVRAFEVADREPAPASPPVEFDGPVNAMWTESSGNSAIAVSHNSDTGKYEAYRLTITCSQ